MGAARKGRLPPHVQNVHKIVGLRRVLWRHLMHSAFVVWMLGPMLFPNMVPAKPPNFFIMLAVRVGLDVFPAIDELRNLRYYQIIKIAGAVLDNDLMQKIVVVGRRE